MIGHVVAADGGVAVADDSTIVLYQLSFAGCTEVRRPRSFWCWQHLLLVLVKLHSIHPTMVAVADVNLPVSQFLTGSI